MLSATMGIFDILNLLSRPPPGLLAPLFAVILTVLKLPIYLSGTAHLRERGGELAWSSRGFAPQSKSREEVRTEGVDTNSQRGSPRLWVAGRRLVAHPCIPPRLPRRRLQRRQDPSRLEDTASAAETIRPARSRRATATRALRRASSRTSSSRKISLATRCLLIQCMNSTNDHMSQSTCRGCAPWLR
jgi:hypothetical protein